MTEDSPYTDELAEIVASRWRRDRLPHPICRCEHPQLAHRTDLKRMGCERCECAEFDHTWNDWREVRTVREEVA